MLVSDARMAGTCGAATLLCRGPWVLTAHMFVPIHFASVHLPELVLSKFVAPSPSHPLVSMVCGACGKYFYLYTLCFISTDLISVTVPGGCRSQGCHGFAPRLAHFTCGTTGLSGTNPQAHPLTKSLTAF